MLQRELSQTLVFSFTLQGFDVVNGRLTSGSVIMLKPSGSSGIIILVADKIDDCY